MVLVEDLLSRPRFGHEAMRPQDPDSRHQDPGSIRAPAGHCSRFFRGWLFIFGIFTDGSLKSPFR